MANFEAKVYKVTIEPHNNADTLELARIGDYVSVVRKGQFQTGDLGVYIQEGSIVPDWLLQKMGLWKSDKDVGKGMLSGTNGNRVKAAKFRGVLSQGLVYPLIRKMSGIIIETNNPETDKLCVTEGQDVAEILGITKYSPPIPIYMAGEVWNAFGKTVSYDIENVKKYNIVLQDGEDVVFTEKLHGTWCCLGTHPESPFDGKVVSSKGLSSQGLAFKLNEQNVVNVYVMTMKATKDADEYDVLDHIKMTYNHPVYVLGECFGPIQDLSYGHNTPQFRVFDVYFGEPGHGRYLNFDEMVSFCGTFNLELVPVLYRGPYSKELMLQYTSGAETISGEALHIREGIVIKPTIERSCQWLSRVILKSVSDEYLLRKGKNGKEVTEYQ